MKRTISVVVAVLVLLGLIGLALTGKAPLWQPYAPTGAGPKQSATPAEMVLRGRVERPEAVVLTAPVGGKVVALGASENQTVTAGQLVLQIDSAQAREQLRAAQAHLAQIRANAAKVDRDAFADRLRLAQLHYEGATANRKQAEQSLAKLQAVDPAAEQALNALPPAEQAAKRTRADFERDSAAVAAAQSRMNLTGKPDPALDRLRSQLRQSQSADARAQARLTAAMRARLEQHDAIGRLLRAQRNAARARQLQAQYDRELHAVQQSPEARAVLHGDSLVKAATEQVAAAERLMAAGALKAPEPARLVELKVRPGMTVTGGQVLARLEPTESLEVVLEASVAQLGSLTVGQRAEVRPARGRSLTATILRVVPEGETARVYLQPLDKMAVPPLGTQLTATLRRVP